MKFICKRRNFFAGRLWDAGDTADFNQQDAASPSVQAHFSAVDAVPVAAPAGEVRPPVVPTEEDGEGSSARENLKHLCILNGIEVRPRMGMKAMREALEARGIVVN